MGARGVDLLGYILPPPAVLEDLLVPGGAAAMPGKFLYSLWWPQPMCRRKTKL